jgi:hypothetical protein
VLLHADSFDIMVMDVSTAYREISEAKAAGKPIPTKYIKQESIEEQFYNVTGRRGNGTTS